MKETIQEALPKEHPFIKAWGLFCLTDEFKNALHWAIATKYDDGRLIDPIQIEQHAKGAMWLAFTKGMEITMNEKSTGSPTINEEPLLKFFSFSHLPEKLQTISKPFCELASSIVETLPRNPERTVALRKLLEAKDCAVRSIL